MARLTTSNAIHTNPNARPKLIGNIAEDKLDLPAGTFNYKQYHRMKRSSDKLRWGNAAHHFGCVVHMLESMKEFDPDSRIFLKVFPDTVNPNYFRNPTEYTRSLRGKSVIPIPCVCLRSLTLRAYRGPGGEAPARTACYARLPEAWY